MKRAITSGIRVMRWTRSDDQFGYDWLAELECGHSFSKTFYAGDLACQIECAECLKAIHAFFDARDAERAKWSAISSEKPPRDGESFIDRLDELIGDVEGESKRLTELRAKVTGEI